MKQYVYYVAAYEYAEETLFDFFRVDESNDKYWLRMEMNSNEKDWRLGTFKSWKENYIRLKSIPHIKLFRLNL